MPKRKKMKHLHHVRNLMVIGFIAFFFVTGGFLLWASSLKIPDLESFEQRKVAQSTKIFDRTGEVLLFDVHEDIQRTVVPFSGISRHVKNATVAIEDAEFYEHNGIRLLRTLKAILDNIASGNPLGGQGGSTITQQVVKNSILTQEKKISRKLKEWVLAVKLEQVFSKEQILELYLNETPYGGNLYGIEEASTVFFNKSAADITLAEAAYLAALPQAPTYYSPYGSHRDDLEARKNQVLRAMFQNGFITKEELETAQQEEVVFGAQRNTGIQAPHFVMFVREWLAEKYGERALQERGFRVITTLDFELQQKAEVIVAQFAEENTEKFNASNAALTAVDPKTGQILVMVGSRNFFDEEIDGNFNVVTARRQPGSAFKPFVYATAFMKGYTPETVVFDIPTQFSTTCAVDEFINEDNCYAPVNYDGNHHGPITFRDALAQSVNIPAVKALYLAGLSDSLQTARSMGITTLTNIAQYGLTLVLGGGEVTLLDITSAYGVFANEGVRNPPTAVLRIEDSEGNVVEEFSPKPSRVIPEQVALQITDVLSDNEARTPAFGAQSFLHFPGRDVAAKTGTTNDFRDAWIIGYTPTIAVGAWAGNNDNSSMEKRVAGFIIAPLWNAFMQEAFAVIEDERFQSPTISYDNTIKPVLRGEWRGSESYVIDTISGKLATELTPLQTQQEVFIDDVHSILHWVNKDDPRGPIPEFPARDPQYKAWEFAVAIWKTQNGIVDRIGTTTIPTELDDVHVRENAPRLSITLPTNETVYQRNNTLVVSFTHEGTFPLARADYFINDQFVGSVENGPFIFSLPLNEVELLSVQNTLTVVGYDSVFNRGEAEMQFMVQQ